MQSQKTTLVPNKYGSVVAMHQSFSVFEAIKYITRIATRDEQIDIDGALTTIDKNQRDA